MPKMFPQQLFVHRESDDNEDDGGFWSADETADAVEDGTELAIYELREVKRKKVTHALE